MKKTNKVKNITIGFLCIIIIALIFYVIFDKTKSFKNVGSTITTRHKAMTASEIMEKNGGATVFIVTRSRIGIELGMGSGFVITEKGKIVTNFHVIENASFRTLL